MQVKELLENWEFRRLDGEPSYPRSQVSPMPWFPASVPGSVHLDLLRAGIIADPFVRAHELGLQWVDEADWAYRTHFDWEPIAGSPRRVLRFNGLDTFCVVLLNGAEIGRSDNMFLPLEVDVSDRLVQGSNELEILFSSAVRVGEERRAAYFSKQGLRHSQPMFDERAFVRKAAYMSGWDWGPRLVSCGIWQPVELLQFASRLVRASVLQERLADGRFRVWVEADVWGSVKVGAEFNGEIRSPGELLEFFVSDPRLWWPSGEGDAILHEVRVFADNGDEIRKAIGLRTIRLIREPDSFGRSFVFEVNGRRIWSRGANWIPNDSFPGRILDDEVRSQIKVCKSLNTNMLRVWGGGLYESEAFYDACDRRGILVWQDFPYACSYYPDGPDEQTAARVEAECQVLRLRDRTCLALWCGNNENSAMYEQGWGGMDKRPAHYYGSNLYDVVLPEVVRRLDPGRDYINSSPVTPNDETLSDSHYWDVWHGRGDWAFYRESKARFSSEFGFASACSLEAWKGVLDELDLSPRSPVVRVHDKTLKPVETFEGMVLLHYPQWNDLEEWIYYSQLNQRDALREGIEHYRRSEFCKGALVWQFNDCWPVQSWAVQDYARHLKPVGFELVRLYAPVMVSIDKHDGMVDVHVVNDSPSAFSGTLVVEAVSTLTGEAIGSWRVEVGRASGERGSALAVPLDGLDRTQTAVHATLESNPGSSTWALLAEPKEMSWGEPELALDSGSVRVRGFAADLVVWNPDYSNPLLDPRTMQSGWRATTVANGLIGYDSGRKVTKLHYRHIGGAGITS